MTDDPAASASARALAALSRVVDLIRDAVRPMLERVAEAFRYLRAMIREAWRKTRLSYRRYLWRLGNPRPRRASLIHNGGKPRPTKGARK